MIDLRAEQGYHPFSKLVKTTTSDVAPIIRECLGVNFTEIREVVLNYPNRIALYATEAEFRRMYGVDFALNINLAALRFPFTGTYYVPSRTTLVWPRYAYKTKDAYERAKFHEGMHSIHHELTLKDPNSIFSPADMILSGPKLNSLQDLPFKEIEIYLINRFFAEGIADWGTSEVLDRNLIGDPTLIDRQRREGSLRKQILFGVNQKGLFNSQKEVYKQGLEQLTKLLLIPPSRRTQRYFDIMHSLRAFFDLGEQFVKNVMLYMNSEGSSIGTAFSLAIHNPPQTYQEIQSPKEYADRLLVA